MLFTMGIVIGKCNWGKLDVFLKNNFKPFFFLPDVFIPMPENLLVNLNENKEVRITLPYIISDIHTVSDMLDDFWIT